MKHPLHPLLIHIPVGLWVASLVFDIIYLASGRSAVAATSYYCIGIGIIGALLAVPAGVADYISIPSNTRPKSLATTHMILNICVTILFVINFFNRHGLQNDVPTLVTASQFILTLVSVAILGVSGYFGGLLVYEHGIGFRPEDRDRRAPEDVRRAA